MAIRTDWSRREDPSGRKEGKERGQISLGLGEGKG